MSKMRRIDRIFQARPTLEGAGVHLKRVFGHNEVPTFDPFLLLDDFHSDNPDFYMKGFPWHPHRGIETVTYMIEGKVEHGDSMGNKGTISGKPINEPVAWYGPIVMNTEEELKQAFQEYRNGTFIKD